MILLTGCRGSEATGAQWNEIEAGVWHIPGERTKNGDNLDIPITPMMQEVLSAAEVLSIDRPYVFASSHLDGAITRHSLSVATRRHWSEIGCDSRFTPHDLRRTVRTKLAEIHVEDHIAERVMGHRLQGMLKVYNQYSYLKEKQDALLRWEACLKRLVGLADTKSKNVIYFPKEINKRS